MKKDSHQGDVPMTYPDKVTTNLPGSRGPISTTSPAVAATSPRRLLSCGNVSATSPAVTATSPQRRSD